MRVHLVRVLPKRSFLSPPNKQIKEAEHVVGGNGGYPKVRSLDGEVLRSDYSTGAGVTKRIDQIEKAEHPTPPGEFHEEYEANKPLVATADNVVISLRSGRLNPGVPHFLTFARRTESSTMRHLLLPLLLAASLVPAFAENDPWMKPPDGYTWPEDADKQPVKDVEIPLSEVPAMVRIYLVGQYSPHPPPASVYARRADLNGDGVSEWFVERPELGGTGGSVYDILDVSDKTAKAIGSLLGGFHLSVAAPTEKWLRIGCSSRAGGGHFTRYLLQYNGKEFETVRNEDHDIVHQKVTLRKIEKP